MSKEESEKPLRSVLSLDSIAFDAMQIMLPVCFMDIFAPLACLMIFRSETEEYAFFFGRHTVNTERARSITRSSYQ